MHYAVGDSAPAEEHLRVELEIPPNAPFLGWAVHTPHEDGFLEAQERRGDFVSRSFGPDPDRAMLFADPVEAETVVDDFDYPAVLVALFDFGKQIASIPVGGNVHSQFNENEKPH